MKTLIARIAFLILATSLVNFIPSNSAFAAGEVIYTKDYSSEIFKRNLDGTGTWAQVGTTGTGVNLVANGNYLYICFGNIRRMNLDGTGLVNLGGSSIQNCTTDGNYIYYGYDSIQSIGRMNMDGSGNNSNWVTFTTTDLFGQALYIDSQYLYFGGGTNSSKKVVARVPLSGGTPTVLFTDNCAVAGITGDGTYLYISHYGCNTVTRSLLNGTSVNTSFITLSTSDCWSIQVWGSYLFMLNNGSIARANLDGTGLNTAYLTGGGSRGMAISGAPTVQTTLSSYALSSTVIKGTSTSISATFSAAGKVTFLSNGKKIAKCISVATSTNSPYVATCNWKPPIRGSSRITASFVGTNQSNLPVTAVLGNVVVASRTNTR